MNRAYAEQLVSRWVGILGLTTWHIHVVWPENAHLWPENDDDFGKFGKDDYAAVWRPKDYETARLYINEELLTSFRPDAHLTLEVAIVHELLHLVTRDIEGILDQLEGQLHRDVRDVIETVFSHNLEAAVDRLAYSLVRFSNSIDPAL